MKFELRLSEMVIDLWILIKYDNSTPLGASRLRSASLNCGSAEAMQRGSERIGVKCENHIE